MASSVIVANGFPSLQYGASPNPLRRILDRQHNQNVVPVILPDLAKKKTPITLIWCFFRRAFPCD